MRAIIIEDERFVEFAESMAAEKMALQVGGPTWQMKKPEGLTDGQWASLVDDVHRRFHFVFVRWAQSHGARCIR